MTSPSIPSSAPGRVAPGAAPPAEDRNDLGLGSVVASQSTTRLLNPDGSFNVRRRGLGWWESQSAYHTALAMTWPKFLLSSAAVYLAINVVFALGYLACGANALVGMDAASLGGPFARAFFFSVETIATIGYGNITPIGALPHGIMVFESLVGLMTQALITGLLFARFARPVAAIRFSSQMVVAPYRGGRGLMFRIVNTRDNQLLDLNARVNCSWMARGTDGHDVRKFRLLDLERSNVMLFPLAWTVVHPIDASSPLAGLSDAELREREFEMIVLITGTDETFAQQVHARRSYRAHEIVWGGRFRNIFNPPDARGHLSVDVHRLDEHDRVELPPGATPSASQPVPAPM
ncbi:MAG TPA: ion channel [Gemmatimonadaceae bacterium]|nr:ion channel [Gemmatimonadaceae bacterium]